MTPRDEQRLLRRVMRDFAAEWSAKWARNSVDGQAGESRPVDDAVAIGVLERAYGAVLRRGGLDHAERITLDEARAFPSYEAVAPPDAAEAWIAAGLKNADLPRFCLLVLPSPEAAGVGYELALKAGKAAVLGVLAKQTDPD